MLVLLHQIYSLQLELFSEPATADEQIEHLVQLDLQSQPADRRQRLPAPSESQTSCDAVLPCLCLRSSKHFSQLPVHGARQIKENPEIERLCDSIASEILLPEDAFLQHSAGELAPSRVLDIANLFGTSIIATARRCHDLRRASLFLATNQNIEWGFGVVRRGPVSALDSDLRAAIGAAVGRMAGSELVFINTGIASGQWKATSASLGSTGTILFLLQLVPRIAVHKQRLS